MQKFIHKKIIIPFLELLKKGITPEKLAQSVTLGFIFGIIPIWGISTSLCAISALSLRLNMVAMQTANYLAAPIQILLLIPFIRFGNFLTQNESFPYSAEEFLTQIQANPEVMFLEFGSAILQGIFAWVLVVLPLGWVLYKLLIPVFEKLSLKLNKTTN